VRDTVSRVLHRRSVMLHQHPVRVLSVTAVVAVIFLVLSYPGKTDTEGAWYYISTIGWFGFLITTLAFLVLAVIAVVHGVSGRRSAVGN
jgi:hypothetical protein